MRQFWNAVYGLRRKDVRQYREQWERHRFLAHKIMLPHVKEPLQFSIYDVIKFPWDKDTVKKRGSRERFDYLKNKWK